MISTNFTLYRRAFLVLAVAIFLGTLGVDTINHGAKAAPAPAAGRTLRAVTTTADQGGEAVVSIELDSMGDEVALSFSVNFDPAKLNTPVITLGSGAPTGTALTINQNQVASGRIGFLLDSMNSFTMSPPARQVLSIKFNVAADAASGPSAITFGNTPTGRSTSNILGMLVPTTYEDGSVTIGTSGAQPIELSGRVVTPTGVGLRNATVTMTDSNNVRRSVPTGSMGYYSFTDVEPGKSYTFTVASRQYRFEAVTVHVNGTITDLNFVGIN